MKTTTQADPPVALHRLVRWCFIIVGLVILESPTQASPFLAQKETLVNNNSQKLMLSPPRFGANLAELTVTKPNNSPQNSNTEKPNRTKWYLTPIGILGVACVIMSWAVPIAMGYLIAKS